MFRAALICSALLSAPAIAKPLLLDSQDTYVTACLDWNDTPERLVQICGNALSDPGISQRQRLQLEEVRIWSLHDSDQDTLALSAAEALTQSFPGDGLSWETLAWLEYLGDDNTRARDLFEKSQSFGITADNLAGMAAAQYRLGEITAEQEVEILDATLALKPDFEWALREKGYTLSDIGQYDDALEAFQAALKFDGQSLYNQYGYLYGLTEMGNWDEALPVANRLLERSPGHYNALSRRSLTLLFLNRPKQALSDAEELLKQRPNDSDGAVRKARALFAMGRRQRAIDYLDGWQKQYDVEAYTSYWLANFYFWDGRSELGFPHIETAVELYSGDYFYHKLRGYMALDLRRLDLAGQDAKQVLELRPGDRWGLDMQAHVLLANGEFDEAFAVIAKADAAGLPRDEFRHYMNELLDQGQFIRAVKLRALYPE